MKTSEILWRVFFACILVFLLCSCRACDEFKKKYEKKDTPKQEQQTVQFIDPQEVAFPHKNVAILKITVADEARVWEQR